MHGTSGAFPPNTPLLCAPHTLTQVIHAANTHEEQKSATHAEPSPCKRGSTWLPAFCTPATSTQSIPTPGHHLPRSQGNKRRNRDQPGGKNMEWNKRTTSRYSGTDRQQHNERLRCRTQTQHSVVMPRLCCKTQRSGDFLSIPQSHTRRGSTLSAAAEAGTIRII